MTIKTQRIIWNNSKSNKIIIRIKNSNKIFQNKKSPPIKVGYSYNYYQDKKKLVSNETKTNHYSLLFQIINVP